MGGRIDEKNRRHPGMFARRCERRCRKKKRIVTFLKVVSRIIFLSSASFFRTNNAIKMVGAIRTDQPAGGFEGQPDLPAQNQVPVQIPEPYFLTFPIHDRLDRRSQPACVSRHIISVHCKRCCLLMQERCLQRRSNACLTARPIMRS